MTILDALADPKLLGPFFAPADSWRAWRAFLAALFGLPMSEYELQRYRDHTGRQLPPTAPAREAWVVAGRRGGKSRMAALVAVYLATFRDYSGFLAPGERGTLPVIAADRRQARTVFGYIASLLSGAPMLAQIVEREQREAIHLRNQISIEVHTASFRSVRGYTLVGAVLDELAFWRDDSSANPDSEILAALRPGMATVPGGLLLGISSPYARRGVLWKMHRRHYGKPGDVLVWQASTLAMNPNVSERVITQAYAEDQASAAAEYGAEFRKDVEKFLSREALDAVVVPERRELPPIEGVSYVAFADPSGGSSDSMTLAVAHRERDSVVLDCVREARAPFSPDAVVGEFASTLQRYGVSRVTGDRYGAEWVAQRFEKAGIRYHPSEKSKSDLYRELLPAVNSRSVELLDLPRLTTQLCDLERRAARGGRDSIDHVPGAHDDVANAVAGVVAQLTKDERPITIFELPDLRRASPFSDSSFDGWDKGGI